MKMKLLLFLFGYLSFVAGSLMRYLEPYGELAVAVFSLFCGVLIALMAVKIYRRSLIENIYRWGLKQ